MTNGRRILGCVGSSYFVAKQPLVLGSIYSIYFDPGVPIRKQGNEKEQLVFGQVREKQHVCHLLRSNITSSNDDFRRMSIVSARW